MATQHGSAIVLGVSGILIKGASGSGKSQLCRRLIEHWRQNNLHASWVADDRFIETVQNGQLLVKPSKRLAGLYEHRSIGIQRDVYLSRAVIDLVVDLIEPRMIERHPSDQWYKVSGITNTIPLLRAPAGDINEAMGLVVATLARHIV